MSNNLQGLPQRLERFKHNLLLRVLRCAVLIDLPARHSTLELRVCL